MNKYKGIIAIKDPHTYEKVAQAFPDWLLILTEKSEKVVEFYKIPENTFYSTNDSNFTKYL